MHTVLRYIALLAVVTLVAALASCAQAPDPMFAPKRGRVVDAAGNGMAGFTVIAAATSGTAGFLGGGRGGVQADYQFVVQTDSQGHYALPAVRDRHDERNQFGRTWERSWIVTVLEPGYLISSDRSSWETWRPNGRPGQFPPSTQRTPKFKWNDGVVEIEPIVVEPFDLLPAGRDPVISGPRRQLTLKQVAVYYRFILLEARNVHDPGSHRDPLKEPQIETLILRMHEYMEQLVCSRPSDEILDYSASEGLMDQAYDHMAASYKKRELKPKEYETEYLGSTYTAGILCSAMKAGSKAEYLKRLEEAREKQRQQERYRKWVEERIKDETR